MALLMDRLESAADRFQKVIESACPESREKEIALKFLWECLIWAKAAREGTVPVIEEKK